VIEHAEPQEPRRLSLPLLLGILVLPVVFAWFLLREGYSSPLRAGAFLYMAITIGIGLYRTS
jgi:uncharacterized ion transporter superfamily protein YfcC